LYRPGTEKVEGEAMEIPVLIEPVAGNGYRARTGDPLGLTAEGASAADALHALQNLVAQRVASGAQLVQLTVPPGRHPWAPFAGTLQGDPLLEDWKRSMAEYRQAIDNDPDAF
jgi:hypothetical protein